MTIQLDDRRNRDRYRLSPWLATQSRAGLRGDGIQAVGMGEKAE